MTAVITLTPRPHSTSFTRTGVAYFRKHQGHSAVAGGIDRDDHELQHPGGQGGNGSTGDPQRRRAELAENENVVQARVGQHGDAEDDHAHGGILRAALHADVDGADGVEDIAEANNPEIGGAQLNEQVVVGHQSHHMEGEEEQHSGHGNRNDEPGVKADAHTAVDAVGVPLAPVLAGQDGESAEQAQDDDLEQVDGRVGGSDSGQLILPQHTHHEGVHKSQGSEYPAVVIPVYSGPRMLMTRNLIYTAVTRARSCVCLVGIPQVFQQMVDNAMEQKRYSGLKARIEELII